MSLIIWFDLFWPKNHAIWYYVSKPKSHFVHVMQVHNGSACLMTMPHVWAVLCIGKLTRFAQALPVFIFSHVTSLTYLNVIIWNKIWSWGFRWKIKLLRKKKVFSFVISKFQRNLKFRYWHDFSYPPERWKLTFLWPNALVDPKSIFIIFLNF